MHPQLIALYKKMINFFSGDPRRCQHWIKVHSLAQQIAINEGMEEHMLFVLEATAMLHDCGIKPGEEKYGADHAHGHVQEVEGPPVAKAMLEELQFAAADIERICYLIAHHHTYTNIDGLDYQILVEADFLVNLFEHGDSAEAINSAIKNIFKTQTGITIAREMFNA